MTNEAKRSEEFSSTVEVECMASELAELANCCCFRSDGWEESIRKKILEKLKEAIVMERDACAAAFPLNGGVMPRNWRKDMEEKPPLGTMPRKEHNRQRALEIIAAMDRYVRADKAIPQEWLQELKDLYGAA